MTALPQGPLATDRALPDKDLGAIRAALVVPEDRRAFDAGLKVTLDKVRVGLDLNELHAFLHTWWLIACDSVKDPEGRRLMHVQAREIMSGKRPPKGRPWRELLAERAAELGVER